MEKSAQGDTKAMGELYDRYQSKMTAYFYRMLWQDRELALDMTQELFTKIIKKPELYTKGKKFSTWIYTIAGNMCKNEYRRRDVRKDHRDTVIGLHQKYAKADDGRADRSAFKDRLGEELGKLNPDQRTVFILRYKQDLSIKEIAEIMACSEGTVKSRVFYTLKKLSAALEEFRV